MSNCNFFSKWQRRSVRSRGPISPSVSVPSRSAAAWWWRGDVVQRWGRAGGWSTSRYCADACASRVRCHRWVYFFINELRTRGLSKKVHFLYHVIFFVLHISGVVLCINFFLILCSNVIDFFRWCFSELLFLSLSIKKKKIWVCKTFSNIYNWSVTLVYIGNLKLHRYISRQDSWEESLPEYRERERAEPGAERVPEAAHGRTGIAQITQSGN